MRRVSLVGLLAWCCCLASGQTYRFPTGAPASKGSLFASGLAFGSDGTLVVSRCGSVALVRANGEMERELKGVVLGYDDAQTDVAGEALF